MINEKKKYDQFSLVDIIACYRVIICDPICLRAKWKGLTVLINMLYHKENVT